MKKLLTILGAVGLTATGASILVSCSNTPTTPTTPGEEKEVTTDGVQASLDALIKDKEFSSEEAVIAAAKNIELSAGLVLDGEPINSEQTIVISVKADKGYKLAQDSFTEFSAKWTLKQEEKEVTTEGVQASLDALIKDKEFASEEAVIVAAKNIELSTGLVLDGEPINSEQAIEINVKADKGYKLAQNSLTNFSAKWTLNQSEQINISDFTNLKTSLAKDEMVENKEGVLKILKVATGSNDLTVDDFTLNSTKSVNDKSQNGELYGKAANGYIEIIGNKKLTGELKFSINPVGEIKISSILNEDIKNPASDSSVFKTKNKVLIALAIAKKLDDTIAPIAPNPSTNWLEYIKVDTIDAQHGNTNIYVYFKVDKAKFKNINGEVTFLKEALTVIYN